MLFWPPHSVFLIHPWLLAAQLRLMDVAPKDLSQIASAMATIGQTEARSQLHFISRL